jgi:hypothetical protein
LVTERPGQEDEILAIGRSIVERIRAEANNEYGWFSGEDGEDVFQTLYLTERHSSLPDHLIRDDLLADIRAMYYQVFDALREELKSRLPRSESLWLAIDPSHEDSTFSVLCSEEQVLLLHWKKAWNFYWPNEEAMALDLGRMYEGATRRLTDPAERRHEPGV